MEVDKGIKLNLLILFLCVVSIVVFVINALIDRLTRESKIETKVELLKESFNANKVLRCKYSSESLYLVSKENGWSIYENKYFKKDELLLSVKSCKY